MYWLLVGLVRSLKSSHKEALRKILLCEDYNDLTSPTSNQIPGIHKAVSIVYDTLKKSFSSILVQIIKSFILTVEFNWVYLSFNYFWHHNFDEPIKTTIWVGDN